jgi:hypothetical protein
MDSAAAELLITPNNAELDLLSATANSEPDTDRNFETRGRQNKRLSAYLGNLGFGVLFSVLICSHSQRRSHPLLSL